MDYQKKRIAESFSKSSGFWKTIYDLDQSEINRHYSLDMIERKNAVFHLLDKYRHQGPCQILDIGCGPGIFLEEAASRGHHPVGIDLSESMVRKAEERLHQRDLSKAFAMQGDTEHLPFQDKSFDAVFCIGVLSYLPDDSEALDEIRRVVKDDGLVVIGLPNQLRLAMLFDPYYYFHGISFLKKKRERDRGGEKSSVTIENFRRYFFWRLPRLFGSHNLSIVETISIGFGPLTFWLKEALNEKCSLLLRQYLAKQASRSFLRMMRVLANHWVICLKKTCAETVNR
jgi:ubiquinone/menaquinone biosynthesis C-methylase UbiE